MQYFVLNRTETSILGPSLLIKPTKSRNTHNLSKPMPRISNLKKHFLVSHWVRDSFKGSSWAFFSPVHFPTICNKEKKPPNHSKQAQFRKMDLTNTKKNGRGFMLLQSDGKSEFLEQRGCCGACLFWLTSHLQCHWAWGNSGIAIFVHKVQYTLGKRTQMQLPLLKKPCTASIYFTLFLHELVHYYSFTIRLLCRSCM